MRVRTPRMSSPLSSCSPLPHARGARRAALSGALWLAVALSPPATAQEGPEAPGGIVAIVGDDPITRSELERRILREAAAEGRRYSLKDVRRFKTELAKRVLDELINDVLILQQAARRVERQPPGKDTDRKDEEKDSGTGADVRTGENSWVGRLERYVTDRRVEAEIERRIDVLTKNGLSITSTQHFFDFMSRAYGLSAPELRQQIRRELAVRKYLWENVYASVDSWVSPNESRHYYRTHSAEFTTPVEVSFRRILLQNDRINAPAAMKMIGDALAHDEPFQEVAKSFSQDYEDESLRGRVITKSFEVIQEYRDPVPEKMRTTPVGEVVGPLTAGNSILYFQIVDRVEGKPQAYEEALDDIESQIRRERRRRAYEEHLERLRERTPLWVFLPETGETGGDDGPEVAEAAGGDGSETGSAEEASEGSGADPEPVGGGGGAQSPGTGDDG